MVQFYGGRSIDAKLLIEIADDEEDFDEDEPHHYMEEVAASNVVILPKTNKTGIGKSKIGIRMLFDKIQEVESLEEHLLSRILVSCGRELSFNVDVSKRRFYFSGNGKKVAVKVPKSTLKSTRFKITL